MNRQTFAWEIYRNKIRQQNYYLESLSIIALFLSALLLLSLNLNGLALQDWDEAIVAQVAKEIRSAPAQTLAWLFPTFEGQPLMNQFPLIPNLIAFFYALGGVNEGTTRFPVVLLTAISVPCLYALGREIFPRHRTALLSALIYLTFLPVVRYGRLAMFDGGVLCLVLLLFWCVLRSRRDLRWSLGIGVTWGLLYLHQGMIGLGCGAIAWLFLAWDTPRLLKSRYLWLGLWLGMIPLSIWYLAQWLNYGAEFSEVFFNDVRELLTNYNVPPWYYGEELLKYSVPWLFFAVYGLRLAWENRNWSWAKLIIVWSGAYFLYISLIATKFPQYILPIYPVLALATGAKLDQILLLPSAAPYPRSWQIILGLLAVVATVSSLYFSLIANIDHSLIVILGAVALTMAIAALLIEERDTQFIPLLLWGMYVSLLLFVSSSYWIWELKEAYPVKPVAAIIRLTTPINAIVFTSFDSARPSLNFYSERQVIPTTTKEILQHWQELSSPYFLLDTDTFKQLHLEQAKILGNAPPHWLMITKIND